MDSTKPTSSLWCISARNETENDLCVMPTETWLKILYHVGAQTSEASTEYTLRGLQNLEAGMRKRFYRGVFSDALERGSTLVNALVRCRWDA